MANSLTTADPAREKTPAMRMVEMEVFTDAASMRRHWEDNWRQSMQEKLEQLAAAMGVTVADVEFFLRLTATQVKSGKEGIEAIQAAFDTAKKLCHSAFYSIRAHDPTNPYGHRDTFLPAVYGLLTAS